MTAPLPQVYLVRHGETAWSLSGQHTGRTDIPLTARGETDARALATRLAGHTFAQVFTSPSLRARQTCELAGFITVAESTAALYEWDYGEYEGRRTAEILVARPDWKLFEHGSPGGESLFQVAARAEQVVARARSVPGDTLIFAHRDILRVVAARWAQLPAIEARRLYLNPASISVLGYDHALDEPIIKALNT
jgi:probable phosphoglycerate mutase